MLKDTYSLKLQYGKNPYPIASAAATAGNVLYHDL